MTRTADAVVHAARARLRVGVFLRDLELHAWEWALLKRILDDGCAEISLVAVVDDAPQASRTLLDSANDLLERRVVLEADAFESRNAAQLLDGVPVLRTMPLGNDAERRFSDEDMAAIKTVGIDVFIRLVGLQFAPEVARSARYGMWSLQHGDERAGFGDPPGFWEVFSNTPVVAVSLRIDTGSGEPLVLDRSFSSTDRTSLRRNNNSLFWKSVSLIPRRLCTLYGQGAKFLSATGAERTAHVAAVARRRPPTALERARYVSKICYRGARNKALELFYRPQWMLMFHLGDAPCMDLKRFRKMIPPKDRYWADPVAVHRENKYYIFIEEVPFATNKGHISVIVMDGAGKFEPPVRVLERPYHLSYPFVFESEGETYMIPESAQNRTVELYQCVDFPRQWRFVGNLLDDVYAVDTTLVRRDGRWWLFANMVENPGASTWDELFLFHSDVLLGGKWTPHPLNPIVSDVTKARPAGPLYEQGGRLYRPAQDCSVRYGYAIRMQEVTRITEDEYDEVEAATIMPGEGDIIGTHMLSYASGLTVIDALQPRLKL